MSARSVDEQLREILASIGEIDPIELTTLDAQGLLLADDVHTEVAIPSVDCADTDGYAIRAIDTRDASRDAPVELPVVGDVVAGVRSSTGVGPGIAARITTGAPMPSARPCPRSSCPRASRSTSTPWCRMPARSRSGPMPACSSSGRARARSTR